MTRRSVVITDTERGVHVADFRAAESDELRLPGSRNWSVTRHTLRGGRSDGVDVIEVDNGALRLRVLPTRGMGIWNGELTFAIGYSEPNAGTDLAALRTKGEKVDGGWKVNGQKIWTSLAAHSTHIWLATRTDPDVKKHKGISVLIVKTDSPGVTIRPLQTISGLKTYETFYDDVFVPDDDLLPPLNGGWPIIMHALNHERVGLSPTSNLARNYDVLVEHLQKTAPQRLEDPVLADRRGHLREFLLGEGLARLVRVRGDPRERHVERRADCGCLLGRSSLGPGGDGGNQCGESAAQGLTRGHC